MGRRIALIAVLAVAGIGSLVGAAPLLAQDAPVACASALWLAPATPEATDDTASREITEPAPTWMTIELVDACSSEHFALADFAGKTVYIESMATWCPPCRDQLARVNEAVTQMPEEERAKTVIVALSSEVGLPPETLAAYAAANDFPFIFAVMTEEMLQSMVDDLGQAIVVAPATPHLIVAPDGTVGEVHTGPAAPEEVLALLSAARDSTAP